MISPSRSTSAVLATAWGATAHAARLDSTGGYDSAVPRRPAAFTQVLQGSPVGTALAPFSGSSFPTFSSSQSRLDLARRAGVTAIYAPPQVRLEDSVYSGSLPALTNTYDGPDGQVWAIDDPLRGPRLVAGCRAPDRRDALTQFVDAAYDSAWTVILERGEGDVAARDPGGRSPGRVLAAERGSDAATVLVDAERPGWLVLPISPAPGWRPTSTASGCHCAPPTTPSQPSRSPPASTKSGWTTTRVASGWGWSRLTLRLLAIRGRCRVVPAPPSASCRRSCTRSTEVCPSHPVRTVWGSRLEVRCVRDHREELSVPQALRDLSRVHVEAPQEVRQAELVLMVHLWFSRHQRRPSRRSTRRLSRPITAPAQRPDWSGKPLTAGSARPVEHRESCVLRQVDTELRLVGDAAPHRVPHEGHPVSSHRVDHDLGEVLSLDLDPAVDPDRRLVLGKRDMRMGLEPLGCHARVRGPRRPEPDVPLGRPEVRIVGEADEIDTGHGGLVPQAVVTTEDRSVDGDSLHDRRVYDP